MIEQPPVLTLLAKLVSIPSVNPAYEGGVSEKECAEFVESFFHQHGIATWRQEVFQDRFNVLACLPGRDRTRRIIFEAHMDTVSIQGMTIPPFDPDIREGKLFGRGSCDTKGGMAAMMQAIVALKQESIQPDCDIIFAAVVDEEFSFRGVVSLCKRLGPQTLGQPMTSGPLQADLAVVAEPTDLKLVVASKGVLRWRIEMIGKAAHSSKPHLGKNAIVAMARVIDLLETDSKRLADRSHPLLGCATINIGVIQGGVQVNFVPDRCSIEIDRRLLPGETWEGVFAGYDRLLDPLRAGEPDIEIVMHPPMLTDYPLENSHTCDAIQSVARCLESLGLDATPLGVPFGSDASKLAAQSIPSIILGPGSIDQAHAAVEYIDCAQVIKAVDVYKAIMHMKPT
jgi:acetylornithine deacetylase/succinyl-diaminopimelate desuccinylase family protein